MTADEKLDHILSLLTKLDQELGSLPEIKAMREFNRDYQAFCRQDALPKQSPGS